MGAYSRFRGKGAEGSASSGGRGLPATLLVALVVGAVLLAHTRSLGHSSLSGESLGRRQPAAAAGGCWLALPRPSSPALGPTPRPSPCDAAAELSGRAPPRRLAAELHSGGAVALRREGAEPSYGCSRTIWLTGLQVGEEAAVRLRRGGLV